MLISERPLLNNICVFLNLQGDDSGISTGDTTKSAEIASNTAKVDRKRRTPVTGKDAVITV